MTSDELLEHWTQAAAAPFEGWDFSHLQGRFVEDVPPWDYLAIAKSAVTQALDILDVATGGGEVLASLAPFPGRVTAVEGFVPNLAVARRRLEPLGVPVLQGNTLSGMPFADGTFDLVINRHGGFRTREMHRILKSGGVFLSQQVGGDNLFDLTASFEADIAYPDNTLARRCEEFEALGCEVRCSEEWRGAVTFADVSAIVYFLKAIPWVVQGFDVKRHLGALKTLQARLDEGEPLRFTYARFLIEAVNA